MSGIFLCYNKQSVCLERKGQWLAWNLASWEDWVYTNCSEDHGQTFLCAGLHRKETTLNQRPIEWTSANAVSKIKLFAHRWDPHNETICVMYNESECTAQKQHAYQSKSSWYALKPGCKCRWADGVYGSNDTHRWCIAPQLTKRESSYALVLQSDVNALALHHSWGNLECTLVHVRNLQRKNISPSHSILFNTFIHCSSLFTSDITFVIERCVITMCVSIFHFGFRGAVNLNRITNIGTSCLENSWFLFI